MATSQNDKPKQVRVFGNDTTTGKKVTIIVTDGRDPANGTLASGTDVLTGKKVTIKVQGRDPANGPSN